MMNGYRISPQVKGQEKSQDMTAHVEARYRAPAMKVVARDAGATGSAA
jgi:hypothetical protein